RLCHGLPSRSPSVSRAVAVSLSGGSSFSEHSTLQLCPPTRSVVDSRRLLQRAQDPASLCPEGRLTSTVVSWMKVGQWRRFLLAPDARRAASSTPPIAERIVHNLHGHGPPAAGGREPPARRHGSITHRRIRCGAPDWRNPD